MGKTKKFLDKKTATTFQLVHRSTGAGDRPDEVPYVLQTANGESFSDEDGPRRGHDDDDDFDEQDAEKIISSSSSTKFSREDEDPNNKKRRYRTEDYEFGEFGFPDDGYDYAKHFKARGGGVYIPSEVFDVQKDPSRKAQEDSERILGRVDPEILAALNGEISAEEEEALDDDFLDKAGGVAGDPEALSDHIHGTFISRRSGFDFDPEEYKRRVHGGRGAGAGGRRKGPHDGFNLEDSEDEDFDGEDDEDRQLLAEQFDHMESQYDDEELGELDDDDPSIRGQADISQFADVINDYLSKTLIKKRDPSRPSQRSSDEEEEEEEEEEEVDEDDEEGGSRRTQYRPHVGERERGNEERGGEVRRTVGQDLARYCGGDDDSEEEEDAQEVHKKWKEVILKKLEAEAEREGEEGEESTENDREVEEVEVDKGEDGWDCESVLSSYTNTENHPKLLDEPARRPKQIKISAKTGLPIGVVPPKPKASSTLPPKPKTPSTTTKPSPSPSPSLVTASKPKPTPKSTPTPTDSELTGEKGKLVRRRKVKEGARPKDETPEEKKERKKALKDERKNNRERKKNLKNKFSQEEQRQKNMISTSRVQPSVVF